MAAVGFFLFWGGGAFGLTGTTNKPVEFGL
jgi:hypothetical protein